MSKYIKLEEAINVCREKQIIENGAATGVGYPTPGENISALLGLPTIDIVNCIECEYRGEDWWCYKHEFTPIPIEDFFCKDGERKDDE